jgi:drug/metabolite transporter (DMT)-like permease
MPWVYKALSYLPSPEAGIIGMTEVVFGGILGLLVFSEPLTWRALIGASLILGSGVCLNLKSRLAGQLQSIG